MDPAVSHFEIVLGRQKFRMCKSLQMGARKLPNDERIPNLVSEFKSTTFDPPFGPKKKRAKSIEIRNFASFRPFLFWQKGVKRYPI